MAPIIHQTQDVGNLQGFFCQSHREQRRAVTTAGKGGYIAVVQNIYVFLSPPLEYHHEKIDSLQAIAQGMQDQSY